MKTIVLPASIVDPMGGQQFYAEKVRRFREQRESRKHPFRSKRLIHPGSVLPLPLELTKDHRQVAKHPLQKEPGILSNNPP
jgi:hypothetical protein